MEIDKSIYQVYFSFASILSQLLLGEFLMALNSKERVERAGRLKSYNARAALVDLV
jgi:hypothetical protein